MPRKKKEVKTRSSIVSPLPAEIQPGGEAALGAPVSELTPAAVITEVRGGLSQDETAALFGGETAAALDTAAAAAADESESAESVGTVTVPLTASGKIAWGALKKEATKEKIRRAMETGSASHEKHQELIGLTKMAPALWMGINMLTTSLVVRKAPEPVQPAIADALAYSKQELEDLAGPTAALLQKYVPASFADYAEEVNFVMVVGSVHKNKIDEVSRILHKYQSEMERKADIAQPERVAPPVPGDDLAQ